MRPYRGPILGVCLMLKSSRARVLMFISCQGISQETICVVLWAGRVELRARRRVFSLNNQTLVLCQLCQPRPIRGLNVRNEPMRGQWEEQYDYHWCGTTHSPGTNGDFHHSWPSQTIFNGNASWRMFLFCHNGDNFPAGSPPCPGASALLTQE